MAEIRVEFAFAEASKYGDVETYWEMLPNGCKLDVSFSETDGVWLAGNKPGLLLLSRLLAEIAVRDFEEGWHTHVLKLANSPKLDFTVEKIPTAGSVG